MRIKQVYADLNFQTRVNPPDLLNLRSIFLAAVNNFCNRFIRRVYGYLCYIRACPELVLPARTTSESNEMNAITLVIIIILVFIIFGVAQRFSSKTIRVSRKDNFKNLLSKTLGDKDLAERLIERERIVNPRLTREALINAAIKRWERDNH